MKAQIVDSKLVVSGAAASSSYRDVHITHYGYSSSPTVTDNGEIGIQVPIAGSGVVKHLDLSGLSGAGTNVYWADYSLTRVTGSQQDDYFNLAGGGNIRVASGLGHDYINTGSGSDTVLGGSGNDTINAEGGDDFIYNELGNDFIDGGEGYDTLIMSGNRADYDIAISEGMYVITHLNNGHEGTDRFGNVEALRFTDQTVGIVDIFA